MAEKLSKLIQAPIDLCNQTIPLILPYVNQYGVDTAVGYWLDSINLLIDGVARPYDSTNNPLYNDAELRNRIKTKISMNKGGGSAPSVINAVRYYLFLDNTTSWESVKSIPVDLSYSGNDIVIEISSEFVKTQDRLGEIKNFIPVGVGLYVVRYEPDETIRLSNTDGVTVHLDPAQGLSGIESASTGGRLAEIITLAKNIGGE
jgi:hypothetical protein